MSQRYLGGVITANPTTPTMTTQSGVWTLEQQFQYFNVWSPKIVGNSLRFRSSASAYLNRTPGSASNRKTWTWSGWVKRGALSSEQAMFGTSDTTASGYDVFIFRFTSSNIIRCIQTNNVGGSLIQFDTTAVYRDPSAWYHVVLSVDTTQATNSNGVRLWVNGVSQAGTFAAYTQNTDTSVNSTSFANYLGRWGSNSPQAYFDGYLTEINFIDGQALTPSSFGAFDSTGVWQPLPYTGTYGTNGFYLTFSDNSGTTSTTLGRDTSGNNNNWTPNNFSLTSGVTYDWMLDSPTNWTSGTGNGRGNYCVLNPLDKGSNVSVLDANLNMNTSAVNFGVRGSIGVNTGKWYWEVYVSAIGSTNVDVGVADSAWSRDYVGSSASSWGYFSSGQKYNNASATSYGATYTTGDTIGVAFDADAATLTFYKNGTSQGQAYSGVSGSNPIFPAVSGQTSSTLVCNFGQRPFAYTPPSGFLALNTNNLPNPTILKGNQYFDATTYTGNGSSLSVTNSGAMQPDLVWTKARSTTYNHSLVDAVRGVSKSLQSNLTNAEDDAPGSYVTAFNSNGFTVGTGTASNNNGTTYVGWQWQAGRGTTSTNTAGSITSTVSVSTTAGFSVVTYTGTGANATVGHGLGVAPSMMIFKRRNAVAGWPVYHVSVGNTAILSLQATAATSASATYFNNTSPTSSVFTVSTDSALNANTGTYVAYLFAQVSGYSAFGSYTGNGSTDGPFVFTGFRPRWVMWKKTSGTSNWSILDTARDDFNVADNPLLPNTSGAETTSTSTSGAFADILSNGFKLRGNSGDINDSGATYIFAAFAENPFKISRAR